MVPQQRRTTRKDGGGGEGGDNRVGFESGFEELVGFVPGVQEGHHLISRIKLLGGNFHIKGKEKPLRREIWGTPTSKDRLERETEGGLREHAEGNSGEAGSCQVSDTTEKLCKIRPERVY